MLAIIPEAIIAANISNKLFNDSVGINLETATAAPVLVFLNRIKSYKRKTHDNCVYNLLVYIILF